MRFYEIFNLYNFNNSYIGLILSRYRSLHRKWFIKRIFAKIFNKDIPDEPLIYSNIPLSVPYVPITEDLLFRKKRFRFGSVILIDETTLVADSMLIKDMELNERLTLFNKLIGHELHGSGLIVYNSQTISDVHFSLKRALGNYFYVHHTSSWLPFFNLIYVRELLYSDDNSTMVNAITKDAELDMRKVIVRKSVWKKYDSCAFSSFTDDLPVEDNMIVTDDLKVRELVSFRTFNTIEKGSIKNTIKVKKCSRKK